MTVGGSAPAPNARHEALASSHTYEALAAFAEAELAAVDAGDIDAALAIQERSAALILTLPDKPPASARPALERAAATQRLTIARLAAERAEVSAELEQLARGRRAAQTYGLAAPPRHGLDQPA